MANTISWPTVLSTARFVSSRFPQVSAGEMEELESDLNEVIPQALDQVQSFTGLDVESSSLRFRVVDRFAWIKANQESYQYLLDRATASVADRPSFPGAEHISGASLGALLGWLSSRVLGQYDLLLQQGAEASPGEVYFVGPNIILTERKMGFQRKQFRHWVALHELTHRAQFEGVPWFRGYFSGLVDEITTISSPDMSKIVAQLGDLVRGVLSGDNPFEEYGIAGLFVTPPQREALEKTTILMSIAEGHGDWVMDRAGQGSIPEAWRFSQSLSERRESARGLAKGLQSLLGLEAKLKQYARGESFIRAIEEQSEGSSHVLWSAAEALPTMAEFEEPRRWCERLGVSLNS